jgi:chromosome segregation ATPase
MTRPAEIVAYDRKTQNRHDRMQESIDGLRHSDSAKKVDITKIQARIEVLPALKEKLADLESAIEKYGKRISQVRELDRRVTNMSGRFNSGDVRLSDLENFRAATEDTLRRLGNAVAELNMKINYVAEEKR